MPSTITISDISDDFLTNVTKILDTYQLLKKEIRQRDAVIQTLEDELAKYKPKQEATS